MSNNNVLLTAIPFLLDMYMLITLGEGDKALIIIIMPSIIMLQRVLRK